MAADSWAKNVYKETISYHHGKDAVKRALTFLIDGKREDAEAELEAAAMQRLKAESDRRLGAIGLARVREEHATYLEKQAKLLEDRAKALEKLINRKPKKEQM